MKNRYLFISDLHLCDVENHADGWKAYKRSEFLVDGELDGLVKRFMKEQPQDIEACKGGEGKLTLVLNGDVFDFDLVDSVPEDPPWPVTQLERSRCLNATAPKSVYKIKKILADHPQFIKTLAAFIAGGHRVVYIMGNHDREFHFKEVQEVFTGAVSAELASQGKVLPGDAIRYEPWFYYVPGEIYAEHGNQYDYYSSFQYLLVPEVKVMKEKILALPMGNLTNRYLMCRMGFFNPFSTDFILNIFSYIKHWMKYYMFSRRNLFLNWFFGSFLVMLELIKEKRRLIIKKPDEYRFKLQEAARDSGLAMASVIKLGQLHKAPITSRFYRIVREFWLDRITLALLMLGGTITLALVSIPLWVKLMVPLSAFPLFFFIYEWLARGDSIFTVDQKIPHDARKVAEIVGVKAVIFGHTHKPCNIPLSAGISYINTGTWAPIWEGEEQKTPLPGLRNYAIVTSFWEQDRPIAVEFGSWC